MCPEAKAKLPIKCWLQGARRPRPGLVDYVTRCIGADFAGAVGAVATGEMIPLGARHPEVHPEELAAAKRLNTCHEIRLSARK